MARSRRSLWAVVLSFTLLAVAIVHASRVSPLPSSIAATVGAPGRPVPAAFLGLSLEYWAVESYAGTDPAALDPVFVHLVRALTPGQAPVLRIGGDSADWSWWPVAGMARPPGVTFTIDRRWVDVTAALIRTLGAHAILGLNLEADSPRLAGTEARALLAGIAPRSVTAFELGNEPAEYRSFAWYRTASGRGVPGRPPGYDFGAFLSDFTRVAAAVPAHALAGPTTGGQGWNGDLGRFLAAEPRVRVVTVHRYPLQLCYTPPGSPRYPTLAHLLSESASSAFAQSFAGEAAVAHARGLPLRIDELNTVSCGAAPAVSETFASALWVIDALFELARVGVDGVQVHTFPGAGYALFRFSRTGGRWSAWVAPEYYGLALFARAVPSGSRLLAISAPAGGGLKLWATEGADGAVRVVLINKSTSHPRTVHLRIPGASGAASLERLTAPSIAASAGIALAGQSFGARTSTGVLAGPLSSPSVHPAGGRYTVRVPPASAALLTVARS